MAYRLNPGEPISVAIKRVLNEEIDSAISNLGEGSGKDRDNSIHEARKSIKKTRGVLRLIQPEIGRRVYRQENGRLREIANSLSELRDAGAMVEIFNDLVANKGEGGESKVEIVPIREHLIAEKRRAEESLQVTEVFSKAVADLQAVRNRLHSISLKDEGWNAIAPGLRRSYRKGRKALAVVQRNGTPENFHQWRKRVKDHWYHIRLLNPPAAGDGAAYERNLKDLETWLGDDHNVTVLRERLGSSPVQSLVEENEPFTKLAIVHAQNLRAKALELGERVYRPKPKRVTKDCARLWAERKESATGNASRPARKSSTSTKIVHPSRPQRAS